VSNLVAAVGLCLLGLACWSWACDAWAWMPSSLTLGGSGEGDGSGADAGGTSSIHSVRPSLQRGGKTHICRQLPNQLRQRALARIGVLGKDHQERRVLENLQQEDMGLDKAMLCASSWSITRNRSVSRTISSSVLASVGRTIGRFLSPSRAALNSSSNCAFLA
jgi:hypothetical protein